MAQAETALLDDARTRLAAVPGVDVPRLWASDHRPIGVLPFVLRSMPYAQLATALSAEYAIGVRHGCFCARRLMVRLLRISPARDACLHDALHDPGPPSRSISARREEERG